jgi:hypothetical protein
MANNSFKNFLLMEGGNATKEYKTERANKDEIDVAIAFVADATGIHKDFLKSNLLGSGQVVLDGHKASAGDIDVAMPISEFDPKEIHKKIMAAVNDEGEFNSGTDVGSYAVPVSRSKKVQWDFMYVNSTQWAKFMYHSAEGHSSRYPGSVRNMLMMAIVSETLPKAFSTKDYDVYSDKNDLRVYDKETGQEIIRASTAIKLSTGLERLFKIAPFSKRDPSKRNGSMEKVTPDEVRKELENIGINEIDFNPKADIVNDPDKVVKRLFGKNSKKEDFLTTEAVMQWCYENLTDKVRKEVFAKAAETLKRAKIPAEKKPEELQ